MFSYQNNVCQRQMLVVAGLLWQLVSFRKAFNDGQTGCSIADNSQDQQMNIFKLEWSGYLMI